MCTRTISATLITQTIRERISESKHAFYNILTHILGELLYHFADNKIALHGTTALWIYCADFCAAIKRIIQKVRMEAWNIQRDKKWTACRTYLFVIVLCNYSREVLWMYRMSKSGICSGLGIDFKILSNL